MRFCSSCSSPLRSACPRCGAENTTHARFCGQCRLSLAGLGPPPHTREPAERRQLTVLFCDLVGSTALSEALDPEDLCEIVRQHQHACTRVIEAYDGHVAQFLGDGILVYFGYPRVHEDAARRAVYAALEMVREVSELQVSPQQLQLRVGIHTGLAVVGEVGRGRRRERLALGETPNIAARVQAAAAPGTIAISQATYAIVRGYVECEELGEQQLKGISRPMALHRVLFANGARTRIDAASSGSLTPYIGRSDELSELLGSWRAVERGQAQAVLIEGEPGIGKSRLLSELHKSLVPVPFFTLTCACAAEAENSALRPLIASIEQALGLSTLQTAEERYAHLQQHGLEPEALLALSSLLSIEPRAPVPPATPAHTRRRTLSFLVQYIRDFAQRGPVLLTIEDLHWADPSTLEYIELLLDACAGERLLLVLTHRPEFRSPWKPRAWLRQLVLPPLPAPDTLALIDAIAGPASLPGNAMRAILQRTDGVPLFVEELTRSMLEQPAPLQSGQEPAIPTSIQDLLSARLERLGPCRVTAQLAATIGREFGLDLLAAVHSRERSTIQAELQQLEQAKLIRRLGTTTESYAFRHALIRDAAYHSLLRNTRREYHRMVAEVLIARFTHLVAQRPELLAQHFAGALMFSSAVEYFRYAAERALERSANREAIAHARAGLALIEQLDARERDLSELALLMCLGPALIASTGFASDDVGVAYARARTLCERLQGRGEVFAPLWGSWVFRLVRGELALAREVAERMMLLGEREQDSAMLVEAHWTLGNALFWLGELRAADAHLARASAWYDREHHHAHAFRFGQDPGVATECYRSFALCLRGMIGESQAALERAAVLAESLAHPFTTAWVQAFRFMNSMFLREPESALVHAERTIEFCAQQAHPFWLSSATVVSGWARASSGDVEAGLATIRHGLDLYESTGSGLVQPLWYALMAEILIAQGRLHDAQAALRTGDIKASASGEALAKVELLRLRGELCAREHDGEAARIRLEQALDLAERLDARTLALRVAVSLHRHLRPGEASPLVELLRGFEREPEFPTLRAARSLQG